jgi:hypothetical protein
LKGLDSRENTAQFRPKIVIDATAHGPQITARARVPLHQLVLNHCRAKGTGDQALIPFGWRNNLDSWHGISCAQGNHRPLTKAQSICRTDDSD